MRCVLCLALLGCDGAEVEQDAGRVGEVDAGAQDARADAPFDLGVDQGVDAEPDAALPACNGHALLCARGFDEVAYATAHNAMSSGEDRFRAPNHQFGLAAQLDAGVRGLMIDTYWAGEALLCHGTCELGSLPLVPYLEQLGAFMRANPREVITLIIEAYLDQEQTEAAFLAAGLEDLLHAQPVDTPWPTLQEMIDADRRLVVLSDRGGGPAWHHPVWDHAGETPFSVQEVEDFDCRTNRGRREAPLFILNHFITNPIAWIQFAEAANANPGFEARALRCQEEWGRIPNFVTVDFYAVGALFEVVEVLNGLR